MFLNFFQNYKQIFMMPIRTLLANKARSFLTMLGVIIGVGAVIVIISVGAGAQSLILSQVKSLGTNIIGVLPGASNDNGPPATVMGIVITTLTYDDAMAIKKEIPNVVDVAAYSKGVATVSWQSNQYDTNLSGTTAGYMNVEGGEIDEGRFFTSEEEKNLSEVAVLGATVKDQLFGLSDPIGQKIKIKNHMFEVIGTMKKRGTVAFQDYDDQVFIPIMTMQKLIEGVNYIGMIRIKINNENNVQEAKDEITALLRERHNISDKSGASDDFTVRSSDQALSMITSITNALKYFLAAMAALSLIIGGIGIMNIMLISVRERTREIGLRKAVGAKTSNILNQFLIEAIAITALGGIIGIIVGVLISFLISVVAQSLGYSWDFIISLTSIILALAVSALVGLVFGLYPAYKASKLEPVEALRYE